MDISKLHPIHEKAYKDLKAMGVPQSALDNFYNKMVQLADVPMEDWGDVEL